MLAAVCGDFSDRHPLDGLSLKELDEPLEREGWTLVRVRAASLNHHDLWTLRGVGASRSDLPITLGCDAAGLTSDGQPVVVHAVVASADHADETLSDDRRLLSEGGLGGTFAEYVSVPNRNLVAKPAELSFEQAACLPTSYLTAYRALFTQARMKPGDRLLIQGAGGGVSTAAILLGRAAGLRISVTSRDSQKLERALDLGAHEAVPTGDRLPSKVDVVLESVGEATWGHSLRALRPGGSIVCIGATSGFSPDPELNRVFFKQIRILGSTMGTVHELRQLISFLKTTRTEPLIDASFSLEEVGAAMRRMLDGSVFGKIAIAVGSPASR